MRFLKVAIFAVLVLVVAAAATMVGLVYWAEEPVTLRENVIRFRIPSGSGLSAVARQIQNAGGSLNGTLFIWYGKLSGKSTVLQAGTYEIKTGVTPLQILDKLARGDVVLAEIRLPEGATFRQWRELMNRSPLMTHDSQSLSDAEILAALSITGISKMEGLLLPDTYRIDKGGRDLDLMRRAYQLMQQKVIKFWEDRDSSVPYRTPYEAMIMASIIEKESGLPADRPMVAAVFVNRLRMGMRLQTDPTVIYGIGPTFDGNLRKSDLLRDTLYNTYTRTGLPPTPICMFSMESLYAALHPADSRALYFVARGDGTSHFSNTLSEHNAAVSRYQLRRN